MTGDISFMKLRNPERVTDKRNWEKRIIQGPWLSTTFITSLFGDTSQSKKKLWVRKSSNEKFSLPQRWSGQFKRRRIRTALKRRHEQKAWLLWALSSNEPPMLTTYLEPAVHICSRWEEVENATWGTPSYLPFSLLTQYSWASKSTTMYGGRLLTMWRGRDDNAQVGCVGCWLKIAIIAKSTVQIAFL